MFNQLEIITKEQIEKLTLLRGYIKSLKTACIAYSGGVDSALVAAITFEQLEGKAIAITGVSPALANHLLEEARRQAKWIGINHIEVDTHELENDSYSSNPEDRCFACKKELHKQTSYISEKLKYKNILDGVNFDDLSDYRPGIKASQKAGVLSPLALFKFSKQDIRDISKSLGFPWWDKPAQPCLSSRFPYGYHITFDRLKMIEAGEAYIREIGIQEVRVRCQGTSARIEIPADEIKGFINNQNRDELLNHFFKIGFKSVSLDLEGLISGKLNR
ncbi:MAG: TIGR00268 family protein [Prochlorococcus sp. SP3034]|nr:TIGR00268 family protein [Prochlorococcus sp. SP3034]|tara:strand:+ start:11620 stop:12444 length:825 start_codon:yes stop_codon:yes gene_type:complete